MKAVELTATSLKSFRFTETNEPAIRRGEVLVRMRAASLNFIDNVVANGSYPGPTFPLIPVADGAGEVASIGDEVDTVKVGDRVAIHPEALWSAGRGTPQKAHAMRGVTLPGSLRESAVVAADTVVKIPDHLSWEQAAALPIAATTAWNALASNNIGPGSTIALLGTGGVSIFALQLAKARGATVIVTSSSDEKLARAKQLGADHVVNYRSTQAWDNVVVDLIGGTGVDLVLETAGSATFVRSINAVRHAGTIFVIGFVSGSKVDLDVMPLIVKALRIQGNNTGSAADLADAVSAIAAHRIIPVIDQVYEVGAVREAYEALASGNAHFGKLAISLAGLSSK